MVAHQFIALGSITIFADHHRYFTDVGTTVIQRNPDQIIGCYIASCRFQFFNIIGFTSYQTKELDITICISGLK